MAVGFCRRALIVFGILASLISVEANPHRFSPLRVRDFNPVQVNCGSGNPANCDAFYVGQHATGTTVCIVASGGSLTVNYPAVPGYTYNSTHVYIGSSPPTNSAPGKFPYTSDNGYCTISPDKTTAQCIIPLSKFGGACNSDFYIATHASLDSTTGGSSQTGWGNGSSFGNGWALYWPQCQLICLCTSTQTFEPIISTTSSTTTTTSTSTSLTTITSTSTSLIPYTFTYTSYSTTTSTPPPVYHTSTCAP